MLWLNFLHFYQPANTEPYNIHKALDKSYWRLLRLLEDHPTIKMTFNVSGCLLERLVEEKQLSFIERLGVLIKRGQVELTASAAYHGFLPLLPEEEIIRQIKINERILKKYFGKNFKPSGFFLPEMAYSPDVARIIKRLGYEWLILDEMAYGGAEKKRPDFSRVYNDAASGLKIIFRNRELSLAYPPDKLLPIFKTSSKTSEQKTKGEPTADTAIFTTATDAELYGLRHEDPTGEMEKIVKIKNLKTLTLSRFIKSASQRKILPVALYPSSWESTAQEIKNNQPYSLWFNKKNEIQVYLWKLAYLSLNLGARFKKDKNYYWHRWHLVRGLASCTFWWASARDFKPVFGPYAWSPDDIERGLEDLVRSVRSFNDVKTKKAKLTAESYYLKIKKMIWTEHWHKHWQKKYE